MTAARPLRQQGVMLLEALIGLLIFSIGILALLGMQAVAMRATVDAKYRAEASFLANEIIAQMWVDRDALELYRTIPSGCGEYPKCNDWLERVTQILPNAVGANAPTIAVAGREVTVTIRWQREGDSGPSNHVAVATINNSL